MTASEAMKAKTEETRRIVECVRQGIMQGPVNPKLLDKETRFLRNINDAVIELVEAVEPISDACWDSEIGEWTFTDNRITVLRDALSTLKARIEEVGE